jgi:hypothetical protein
MSEKLLLETGLTLFSGSGDVLRHPFRQHLLST